MPLWPSKAKNFYITPARIYLTNFSFWQLLYHRSLNFILGLHLFQERVMTKKIIKELNDNFRKSFLGGRVMITQKVQMLSAEAQRELFDRVKQFNDFTKENDPYGEHDFGSIKFQNDIYFWKIDYYDINFLYHSPDPSNTSITNRVLTIMHADEY